MRPFMKTMMSFTVGLLASSAVVSPAFAGCTQSQWENGDAVCTIDSDVSMGLLIGEQDWGVTEWNGVENYAPVGSGYKEISQNI